MSAADLPDQSCHTSPRGMARHLVTYLDDPVAIRRAIKLEFEHCPSTTTIERMRREFIARRDKPVPLPLPCDAHRPEAAWELARLASNEFLKRLDRERELSERDSLWMDSASQELQSPFLTQPALVDKRWDKETEQAWRGNDEL